MKYHSHYSNRDSIQQLIFFNDTLIKTVHDLVANDDLSTTVFAETIIDVLSLNSRIIPHGRLRELNWSKKNKYFTTHYRFKKSCSSFTSETKILKCGSCDRRKRQVEAPPK